MRRLSFLLVVTTLLSFAIGASALATSHPAVPPGNIAMTIDETFAEIDRVVPGFGGLVVDEPNSVLKLYLTNPGSRIAVQKAAASLLGRPDIGTMKTVVLPARYRFTELKTWYDSIKQVIARYPDITFTDIDEAHNNIRLGILEEDARLDVQKDLKALGVPLEAVVFEKSTPILPETTLQDYVRPVVGGLRVEATGSGACTLGFNATRNGVSGFVTASHCTYSMGSVDPSVFYQPVKTNSSYQIGTESVDPAFFTGGSCPAGKQCRYSDSVFVTYDSGISFSLGKVARTTGFNSLTIDSSYPNFNVTGKRSALAGETVHIMGSTSGWKSSYVNSTCVDVSVPLTTKVILCMTQTASMVTQGGDSGGPWFQRVVSPDGSDITLAGIHYGADSSYSYYSAIGDIERAGELGTLTVQ